jgi:hypothetical protein
LIEFDARSGVLSDGEGAPEVADFEARREILWIELLQLCGHFWRERASVTIQADLAGRDGFHGGESARAYIRRQRFRCSGPKPRK